ncbi:hypothetical protein ACFO8O_16190 [Hephaestia sp. GCM10023244]|uniref:hypothetical protein n=1 Tax=unclassified Hephaestia TaxID=2631281 RepID=UPI00207721BC|nr:hypothetical protein [Hephaestia sp. MAHUQ-44]MCM8732499.1 hypothetical protein [Hephaestia sp. MAHUQ-44]
MTASKFEIIATGSAPVAGRRPSAIANSASGIECAARFDGLHTRFRAVILRVLEHHEGFEPTVRSRLAFVKRLFKAWQTLKDPGHAASTLTLWRALRRFEAEVALAECELEYLEFEITAAPGRRQALLIDAREAATGSRLVFCGSGGGPASADG